jgi:transposase
MAMGKRKRHAKQASMWVATQDLPRSAAHPFYTRLNQSLDQHDFDGYVEGLCQRFYADDGRPGLAPGRYFRLLLIGYFEGLDAERAIAWRAADSLALREFLGLVLPEAPPDHSTISRTRRLIDLETHEAVFTWMLQRLADAGLVKGKTVGIDATTLEANAALRSIVRRDTGESYQDFLTKLAQASGIETPTRADLARIDRTRKKKGSNDDWMHPHDPDAKITKMKDGRTHLAHKAEHAVDLETGAIVGVTVQDADDGDTQTSVETLIEAAEQVEAVRPDGDGIEEIVGDKGYHSNQSLGRLRGDRRPQLHLRTGSGPAELEEAPRGARGRVPQSSAHSRPAGAAPAAAPRGTIGTALCPSLRDRRHAPRAPPRTHEHPQARADPRRWLQSRAPHAATDRRRHAARAPGPRPRRAGHAADAASSALGVRDAS